jgi:hypothetical protein
MSSRTWIRLTPRQRGSSAGWLAESDSVHSGPVQTFRLTQASVYQAQESGLTHAQIVERESRKELVALLDELGLSVSRQLTHQELP